MARIIEENGRAYLEDNGRIVAAADNIEDLLPDETEPIGLNSRVEVDGKLGYVKILTDSIYGRVASVRLDNGEYENHYIEELKHSDAEPVIQYESSVERILAEFEDYQQMPIDSLSEIQERTRMARQLNLRAKALTSDSKLPIRDRVQVDPIVAVTSTDILFLKEAAVASEDSKEYLGSQPKYAVHFAETSSDFRREDISWIVYAADEVVEEITDEFLSVTASSLIEKLTSKALKDDEHILQLSHNSLASFASGLSQEEFNAKLARYREFISRARRVRLALEAVPMAPPPTESPMPSPSTVTDEAPPEEADDSAPEDPIRGQLVELISSTFGEADLHADGTLTFKTADGNEYEINVKHLGLLPGETEVRGLGEPPYDPYSDELAPPAPGLERF